MCEYYVEISLICNFHPSRARNYATTVISKLNNFAEVFAVRVHVDVYMATAALRSLTHETLCDTGQRTADTLKFTNHHLPITKSPHFKPSILVFFAASPQKIIDGKKTILNNSILKQFDSIGHKDNNTKDLAQTATKTLLNNVADTGKRFFCGLFWDTLSLLSSMETCACK